MKDWGLLELKVKYLLFSDCNKRLGLRIYLRIFYLLRTNE